MLGLIRNGKDTSTLLSRCLGQCLDECPQTTNDLIEELKARGGKDQTLMFLTGPAGAGKLTAVNVWQKGFALNSVGQLEIYGVTHLSYSLHTQDLQHPFLVVLQW